MAIIILFGFQISFDVPEQCACGELKMIRVMLEVRKVGKRFNIWKHMCERERGYDPRFETRIAMSCLKLRR